MLSQEDLQEVLSKFSPLLYDPARYEEIWRNAVRQEPLSDKERHIFVGLMLAARGDGLSQMWLLRFDPADFAFVSDLDRISADLQELGVPPPAPKRSRKPRTERFFAIPPMPLLSG